MHSRQLRQLAVAVLMAVGGEAVLLYVSRGSSLWREILLPLHFLLAALVLFTVWSALRRRGRGDRRRGDRRGRQARGV